MAIRTEIAGGTIVPKPPSFEEVDYSTLEMREPAMFIGYQFFRYWTILLQKSGLSGVSAAR
jgi:hypothetical protein